MRNASSEYLLTRTANTDLCERNNELVNELADASKARFGSSEVSKRFIEMREELILKCKPDIGCTEIGMKSRNRLRANYVAQPRLKDRIKIQKLRNKKGTCKNENELQIYFARRFTLKAKFCNRNKTLDICSQHFSATSPPVRHSFSHGRADGESEGSLATVGSKAKRRGRRQT